MKTLLMLLAAAALVFIHPLKTPTERFLQYIGYLDVVITLVEYTEKHLKDGDGPA